MSKKHFDSIFTTNKPIILAFHGYPWLIYRLTYAVRITKTSTYVDRRHNDNAF
ncbi:hypothetical protein [Chroogloeocystis siderophila]|uniref:phosphoketolase family protein n=1 Tax=Chroogloeocystis siderophila TaxID=329163 RepID=UPI0038B2B902